MARKAAALLQSMVGNHGFVDANKRTAWLLVELLINRSGYELEISPDEPIDDLVVDVASGRIAFEELTVWFAAHLTKAAAIP